MIQHFLPDRGNFMVDCYFLHTEQSIFSRFCSWSFKAHRHISAYLFCLVMLALDPFCLPVWTRANSVSPVNPRGCRSCRMLATDSKATAAATHKLTLCLLVQRLAYISTCQSCLSGFNLISSFLSMWCLGWISVVQTGEAVLHLYLMFIYLGISCKCVSCRYLWECLYLVFSAGIALLFPSCILRCRFIKPQD